MTRNIQLARQLRRTPTWAEKTLWRELRNRRFAAFKFRRQYPVGPYVLDFFCVAAKLAAELDGDPHGTPRQQAHDRERDAYLTKQRIRVLRFWNVELKDNREGVMTTILTELEKRTGKTAKNPHPDPLPYTTRERGTNSERRSSPPSSAPISSPPLCGGEDTGEGAVR